METNIKLTVFLKEYSGLEYLREPLKVNMRLQGLYLVLNQRIMRYMILYCMIFIN